MERKRDNGQLQRYARIKIYLCNVFFFVFFRLKAIERKIIAVH